MSGTDIVLPNVELPQVYDNKQFQAVSQDKKYLPYLTLMSFNSDAFKSNPEKIKVGNWYLVTGKDVMELIGPEFDAAVLAWRPKAVRIGDEVLSYFHPENDEFQKIKDTALNTQGLSGCMFGPEYLLWMGNRQQFVTMYLSSTTARNEAPKIQQILDTTKLVTTGIQLLENKKKGYKWHGPSFRPCSAPLASRPDQDEKFADVYKEFLTPKDAQVEAAPAEAAGGRAR